MGGGFFLFHCMKTMRMLGLRFCSAAKTVTYDTMRPENLRFTDSNRTVPETKKMNNGKASKQTKTGTVQK